MSVEQVLEPAAEPKLVPLAVARELLGWNQDAVSDVRLGFWLDAITARISKAAGRVFPRERVIERVTIDAATVLLSRYPIDEVFEVTTTAGEAIAPEHYDVVNGDAGIIHIVRGLGVCGGWYDELEGSIRRRAGRSFMRLRIDYAGGYTTIPADLMQAALDGCRWMRAGIEQQRPDLVSERLGDYSYTLATRSASDLLLSGGLPPEVATVVTSYARASVW